MMLLRRGRWLFPGRAARRAPGLCAALYVAGFVALACASPAGAALVDLVVGAVDTAVVSASDIALARALGLFGLTPSDEPIRSADVDRYGTALIAVLEASRLGIGPTLTELDQAWAEMEARVGGAAALRAWFEATAIDAVWARRALEAHLRWHTWQTLHEGLTIESPGAAPAPPGLESDLVLRNLLPAQRTVSTPFVMPPRTAP
jgi:hypothetical protein